MRIQVVMQIDFSTSEDKNPTRVKMKKCSAIKIRAKM